MEYGRYAVLMDLADVGHNVKDGCHIASMGGTWMVLVNGFAGMRDHDGQLSFHPRLPKELKSLSFPLTFRDRSLKVVIDDNAATYTLRAGPDLNILHCGEEITLAEGIPISKDLP